MKKRKAPPKKLTPLQQAFVREYLNDPTCNGTRSAIRAGYSEDCAAQQAYENLRKPEIKAEISMQLKARYKRLDITGERILAEIMLLATADIGDAYDVDGNLLPIKDMPEHIRRAVAQLETEELWGKADNMRVQVGETKKLKLFDKKGSLELLAKHLKLLIERLEHTGKDGTPLLSELTDEQLQARLDSLLEQIKKGSK